MPSTTERHQFKLNELTLTVKTAVNRNLWNEDRYEPFLDELCSDREYQKEAIKTALRYVLGGEYNNLYALAKENWNNNSILHERYGTFENFVRHLQLPDKLSATIDLATGTGKSYVIYGIAVILLAEGVVDRILVLCPSTTIEFGLIQKFKELASSSDLSDLLPVDSTIKTPSIINASQSITPGCICIENRDAIYEHVRSSIKDSLWAKSARVAVLNDEAHHIANQPDAKAKKWKEFLQNNEYGFHIILGFSGTCYVGNDYFSDVIYRFSLREAMEQRYVKIVRYIAEEPKTGEEDERWQLIVNRHNNLQRELKKKNILPLTIIITPTIKKCKEVGEELRDFLVENGKLTEEESYNKILMVYNNSPDLSKLRYVDAQDSEVEWIISVSMLNEGWDVKRVFQIVPHEERAFNSKLLIAQVLGRGLRIPLNWTGNQAEVTVFNHAAWAGSIRHLVNEVLENERRISSKIIPDSPYHFDLHNLSYKLDTKSEEVKKVGPFNILKNDIVDLPSEGETIDVSIDFEKAITETRDTWKTTISRKMFTPEEVAAQMYNTLEYLDMETSSLDDPNKRTNYSSEYPYERLLKIVKNSLKGDSLVSERNRQRLLSAIGTIRRPATRVVRYDFSPEQLYTNSTKDRPTDNASAAQLKRDKVIFITEDTRKTLNEEQIEFFDEIKEPDSTFKRYPVPNKYDFKTPLNMVIADAGPERNFIKELISAENASRIDAWIKSTSIKFYGIDYVWRKSGHPKRGVFNPDFFIKIDNTILVVEIKDDSELSDPSPENIKKNEFAITHFDKLNKILVQSNISITYYFHFVSPIDFPEFFKRIREETITTFRSKLDVKLKEFINGNGLMK